MSFRFVLGKKQKNIVLINKYINLRLQHKKQYKEQLDRLDTQLQYRRIDETELDRLKTILEAKYYQQQQEDLNRMQKQIR